MTIAKSAGIDPFGTMAFDSAGLAVKDTFGMGADPYTAIGSSLLSGLGGMGGGPSTSTGAAYGAPNYINVGPVQRDDWKKWAIAGGIALLVYAVWQKQG